MSSFELILAWAYSLATLAMLFGSLYSWIKSKKWGNVIMEVPLLPEKFHFIWYVVLFVFSVLLIGNTAWGLVGGEYYLEDIPQSLFFIVLALVNIRANRSNLRLTTKGVNRAGLFLGWDQIEECTFSAEEVLIIKRKRWHEARFQLATTNRADLEETLGKYC